MALTNRFDFDGDRHGDATCGGDDCNDMLDGVHPGAVELCNGRDDDCVAGDEEADGDGDGWVLSTTCTADSRQPGDCDDDHASSHPGATEVCNAFDDDCNAAIDDGLTGCDPVVQITGGTLHTCARHASGLVRCWGIGERGQVGDGASVDRHVPTAVTGLTSAGDLDDHAGARAGSLRRDRRRRGASEHVRRSVGRRGDVLGQRHGWPAGHRSHER